MALYDISMRIRPGMLAWPGSTQPEQTWDTRLDRGEESNASAWRLGSHAGTHVDAPAHFIQGGALLSAVPLELFVGPCTVVELGEGVQRIDRATVEGLRLDAPAAGGAPADLTRVLFKTSNSARRLDTDVFDPSFVAFTPDGAEALLALGVKLLGIDYLSVEPWGNDAFPTHRTLLGAGVVAVEGLDLRAVPPGRYLLACLPLRVDGAEAAPARAVLLAQ